MNRKEFVKSMGAALSVTALSAKGAETEARRAAQSKPKRRS